MKKKQESIGPTCKDCAFWIPDPDSNGQAGECFRYPPSVLFDTEEGLFSMRPFTEGSDKACGEFRAKQ